LQTIQTVPGNGYDFKSGSSMSAPVVSGVAALLFSYFPSLTAKQVKEILLKSVFKPNQMVNKPQTKTSVLFSTLSVSGGIVNAYNAVKMSMELTKISFNNKHFSLNKKVLFQLQHYKSKSVS